MRFFQRGETADSKFTFLDAETNEPVDVDNPVYKITYFDGAIEMFVVNETAMTKVSGATGVYVVNFLIPGTIPENETLYVTAKGIHPVDGVITEIEDFYRILPPDFFSGGGGGGGGGGGLVAKFTKP